MLKHRFLIATTILSLAAIGLSPVTYAREAQPGDDRGARQEIQVQDDRGIDMVQARDAGDDNGVDAQPHGRSGDDNGVDAQPHG